MSEEPIRDGEPDRAALGNALRELEAAKARVERDARAVGDETRKQLVGELLPILDNLDRTIANAQASGDAPAVVEGAVLVRAQLEGVMRGYGVERIDAIGRVFDPATDEAIAVAPGQRNVVIDQIAPAYAFNGTLLRPARVIVGSGVLEPPPRPIPPLPRLPPIYRSR